MMAKTSPPLTGIPLDPLLFFVISESTARSFAPPRPRASLRASSSGSISESEEEREAGST